MDNNIETKILNDLLKLNKGMYEKATYPHKCNICQDDIATVGYRKKVEYVNDWQDPHIFICTECYEELPDAE